MKQSIIQTKKYTGNLRSYWLNFTLCSLFGKSGHAAHMHNLAFCLSDVYKSNTPLLLTNREELNAFFLLIWMFVCSGHCQYILLGSYVAGPGLDSLLTLAFMPFHCSMTLVLKGRYTSVSSWLYIETIPSPFSSWKAIYYPSCLYCLHAIPRRPW